MKVNHTAGTKTIGRSTVRSASKLALTALVLVFLLALSTLLPGMDRVVPATPLTFATVVGVLVTVVLVVLLLHLAGDLAALTAMTLSGPEQVVEHVASVVHWLVVLAAVLVAHRGLTPAVAPFLDGRLWLFDLAFFIVALAPLAIVASRLYVSLDPLSDLIADRVAGEDAADEDASTSSPD